MASSLRTLGFDVSSRFPRWRADYPRHFDDDDERKRREGENDPPPVFRFFSNGPPRCWNAKRIYKQRSWQSPSAEFVNFNIRPRRPPFVEQPLFRAPSHHPATVTILFSMKYNGIYGPTRGVLAPRRERRQLRLGVERM